MVDNLPILGRSSPIPLAAVLEPVAHLRGIQAGGLGQLPLLGGIRVGIL